MSTTVMNVRFGRWLWHGAGQRLLLALATAAALTALAPLHTAGLSWLARATEFTIAALVWEIAMITARTFLSWTSLVSLPMSVTGLAFVVVTASVPATAAIAALLMVAGERTGPLSGFYGGSLLLGLLVAFARRGLRFGSNTLGPPPAQRMAPDQVRCQPDAFLRNRAPNLAGGRLLALEADDHYLRVHSDRGSEMILLRMRDAVDELGPGAGWKPHRSFWLSASAGGRAVRRGQAWQIVLENGLTVPVSKTAVQTMRSAGYSTR